MTRIARTLLTSQSRSDLPLILALGLWVGLMPAGSWAQSPGQLGEVALFGDEEFTIQAATKTELPISKAPGSVTVISAQQIRESGSRTIPELLRTVAGVNVRWNPMVQSLDIRSFGQNPFTSRVLLLIDGVPYNSWNKGGFPQHPGFDFFMMQNIKRLEIVRGPGSSLYGENAYWGVVNIVTLSGEDLQGGKFEVSGGDLLEQSVSAVYGRSTDKGSVLVSGRLQRGQLPTGFWFEDNSDAEIEGSDIFVKAKRGGFEVSYYRHQDELDGFSNPLGFIPGASFRSADKIEQTVDILAFKTSHELRSGLTFSSDISYAQREGSRCSSCHAAPENPAFADTVDHGFQLIGDFRLGLQMIPSHDILIGVEARRVDAGDQEDQLIQPTATFQPVLAFTKIAAYVQDQISLAQDRFRLTLGARFDGSTDLFDSELSPRIAAVYTLSDSVVLRGGWSTAFRFPNFNELYQDAWFLSADTGFFAFPLAVFGPNPDLRPEEIRTFDLGAEFQLGPQASLKVDVFQSEVKDFVVLSFQEPPVGPTRIVSENHPGEATIRGGEVELRWQPSRKFSTLFNWSYQENDQDDALVDSSGKPFEFVYSPENKFNLSTYLGPFRGFRATLEAEWRDERIGPSAWNFASGGQTAVTLDSYTLVNARLSWDAPVRLGGSDEALRFSIYGKNLLDEDIEETFLPIATELPGATYYGAIEVRY
ncbi:MAG: TonB-dependent receptor [Acidobacteriota bacterium]